MLWFTSFCAQPDNSGYQVCTGLDFSLFWVPVFAPVSPPLAHSLTPPIAAGSPSMNPLTCFPASLPPAFSVYNSSQ